MTFIEFQQQSARIAFNEDKKRFVNQLYWLLLNEGHQPILIQRGEAIEVGGVKYGFEKNERTRSYRVRII